MQFLCEFFIGDTFKLLLFTVPLFFTFYPSKQGAFCLYSQLSVALGQFFLVWTS